MCSTAVMIWPRAIRWPFSVVCGKPSERLSHPFPSKPRLFGQTFERRETEPLLGCVDETLRHSFESTGLFFDRVLGECLCVWGPFAWSATTRLILQTLSAMMFPGLDP